MPSRSRRSVNATIGWLAILVVVRAAWGPGLVGQVALVAAALIGAGLLWNLDGLTAAWREDRETKRSR